MACHWLKVDDPQPQYPNPLTPHTTNNKQQTMSFLIELLCVSYIGLVFSTLIFSVVWSIHKIQTEMLDDYFKYHNQQYELTKQSHTFSHPVKQSHYKSTKQSNPNIRPHNVQRRTRVGGVPDINGWGRDGRQQQQKSKF
jgi:hypothetical protein